MSLSVAIRHRQGDLALDVAFDAPGGVISLFGRSGAGKTTVTNAIAGLLRPDEGRVCVDGVPLTDTARDIDLPPHRRGIGYVFQDARLFPHMTVARNIGFGRRFAGGRDTLPEADIVDLLGLGALMGRRPAGLSGGEAQRVAIARALLSGPRLLLLDEPLASLDQARKAEILPYLERIRDDLRVPMVHVSHSVAEVARLATSVVVIDAGRVLQVGAPAVVLADPLSATQGAGQEGGALLTARVVAHHPGDGLSELAGSAGTLFVPLVDAAAGHAVRVRVAASEIMIARQRPGGISALNILPATVTAVTPGPGAGCAVSLKAGEDALLASLTRRSVRLLDLAPGTACFAVLKSMRVTATDIGGQGV